MNFLNALGNLGGLLQGGGQQGTGYDAIPLSPDDYPAGTPPQQMQAQRDLSPAPYRSPYGHGAGHVAGLLGEAIANWAGYPATYSKNLEVRQRNDALKNFLDDPEGAVRALMQVDPVTGIQLYQEMHPKEKTPEPFTLGSGEVRYGPKGEVIARGDPKRETVEIDGVVFDKNSGQPLFESPYNKIIPGEAGSFYQQPRLGIGRGGDNSLPRVNTPEEAHSLPPGTQFITPDGRIGTVPGGATASPSPTFL